MGWSTLTERDSRVEGVLHVDGVEGETPMSGDKDIGRR